MKQGRQLPDFIKNAPQLLIGLDFYLQAFYELDADRGVGFALSPIPWSSMASYATFYSLNREEAEDFFFLIRQMDNAYLRRRNDKTDQTSKPT